MFCSQEQLSDQDQLSQSIIQMRSFLFAKTTIRIKNTYALQTFQKLPHLIHITQGTFNENFI